MEINFPWKSPTNLLKYFDIWMIRYPFISPTPLTLYFFFLLIFVFLIFLLISTLIFLSISCLLFYPPHLSLLISMSLFLVTGKPFFVVSSFSHRWLFGWEGCRFYGWAGFFFGCGSLTTMTVVSLDRYLKICHLRYGASETPCTKFPIHLNSKYTFTDTYYHIHIMTVGALWKNFACYF